MAKPAVFVWPEADDSAIASSQSLVSAGFLPLNGPLVQPNYNAAVFPGISRTVTLTAAGNLSGINLTITGTLNGEVVSEVIAGPNATTISSVNEYNQITSVYSDGAIGGSGLSIGSGFEGHTNWWTYNMHATVVGFSVQAVVSGTVNYTFETTLDDVQSNSSPAVFMPIDGDAGSPGYPANMINATASSLANYNQVTRFSRIKISDIPAVGEVPAAPSTGSLVATFVQQGIT